jgi:hypothetical protein
MGKVLTASREDSRHCYVIYLTTLSQVHSYVAVYKRAKSKLNLIHFGSELLVFPSSVYKPKSLSA